MKAVRKHTTSKWIVLYVERWLTAPVQYENGSLEQRTKGTPQGGVISPLLANLYLHYAFDMWMKRNYPSIPFERYADDAVVHLKTEAQARRLQSHLGERLQQCHLEMHPVKTKIVYCKDEDRKMDYPNISFVFLGYEFRPRGAKNKNGKMFVSFLPATSRSALTKMKKTVSAWRLKRCTSKKAEDLSNMFNPIIRGWIQYYGKYYKSSLFGVSEQINQHLTKWMSNKYKTFRRRPRRARRALVRIAREKTNLFAHWSMLGRLPGE